MWKYALPRLKASSQQPGGPSSNRCYYERRSMQTLSQPARRFVSSVTPRMLRPRHVSFLFAMATVAMIHQPHLITLAEAAAVVKPIAPDEPEYETLTSECPIYGCALYPQDIYFDTKVKEALQTIRPLSRKKLLASNDVVIRQALEVLESSGNHQNATLTLIGYKGGAMNSQINQDRALVMAPYHYNTHDDTAESVDDADPASDLAYRPGSTGAQLIGVFDGHARYGEQVSQYAVTELPKLLTSKLSEEESLAPQTIREKLVETFIELDRKAPAEISGGCTATVVLQLGRKVYVANAGDSRSFLVAYHKVTKQASVVYISREDKPHLADERERVEQMGGQVYNPMTIGGTSRVLYVDPRTGNQNGLAMSRSIGDWEVGKLGVIPDPIVDVIDIPDLVKARMEESLSCISIAELEDTSCVETYSDDGSDMTDDIHIFAVSASDGMMDYVEAEVMAAILSESLFEEDGPHLLTACERLVSMAASGWQSSKQGRYRDDIAIAVSKIRTPSH